MDTILIFAFIFGLFAWGIWWLLRFTRDTVGENSPLKVSRTYQISEFRYFTGMESLLVSIIFLLAMSVSFVILKVPFSTASSPFLAIFLFFLGAILLWSSFALSLTMVLNNWKYTKGVTIITHPSRHEVEVVMPGRIFILKSGDIKRIDYLSGDSRMSNMYVTYHLVNGEQFVLSGTMPGCNVITEYFPKVETTWTHKQFVFLP